MKIKIDLPRMAGLLDPVNCIISTPKHINVKQLAEAIDKIPIVPVGNLWVLLREPRDASGCMSLYPEKLVIMLADKWHLADKVFWSVGKGTSKGVLVGKKQSYKYLGSNGIWMRFTKSPPNEAWFYVENSSNVWSRSLDEAAAWYEPFVQCSCPKGGTVAGLFCNEYVEQAVTNLELKYVDIGNFN